MARENIRAYPIVAFYNDGDNNRSNKIQGVQLSGLDYLGLATVLYGSGGLPFTDRTPSADGIGDTTPRGLDTIGYPYTYDPIADTWSRKRGNHSGSLLASAARTASVNSTDQTNYNGRGVHVIINVSAYPAAASIVPTIQGYDPVSTVYYDLLIGSAITATGYTILKVYPGIGEVPNGAASDLLPQTWRLKMTHADTDSITYSAGFQLVI